MKKIFLLIVFISITLLGSDRISAQSNQISLLKAEGFYLVPANTLGQDLSLSEKATELLGINGDFLTEQNTKYLIKGIGNKCLDVSGASTQNGTNITLWACHGGPNQQWSFNSGSLRGIGNKCLDVDAAENANGYRIQLWDCNGGQNQKWQRTSLGQIRGWGNRCLDVKESKTADGTPVIIYSCTGDANQKWRLERPKVETPTTSYSCIPNANQVAIFLDSNYKGKCTVRNVGRYRSPDLLGMPNDSISSIKVGRNVYATVCRDYNFGGICEDIKTSDSWLGNNSRIKNDQVSSVIVRRKNTFVPTPRGSTVYTGCGYTYKTKNARDTQCGRGGTSKWIGDGVDESKMTRGQTVYTGCGYTYASRNARDTQCGRGGTSKWIRE